ncbi:MAG: NAD(P)-binding domain-containing protein, partial [Myxococcales bacterium]
MAETIGVVGVGLLGSAVSSVLLEAGHPLVIHDLVAEKVEALVKRGARGARSAADVASNARVVFTVLPTLESVEEAIGEVLSAATKETVIVQMSTISPDLAVRMDEAARSRGAALLDAPVSGTSA